MSKWIVYSKDGQTERCVLHAVEYGGTHMGERAVTSSFTSPVEVEFGIFDYIEYRNEKFELEAVPTVKKISSFEYAYELRFVSLKYELERCEMRDLVHYDNEVVYPTPLTFSFTGDVRYLTERIQACLDALYGNGVWNIVIADGVESEEKNISISQQNCWNALALANTTYGLNFYIKGRTITIGGDQPLVSHEFEYGKGNGLYEIERASDSDTGIVTKLRAYGSTRNLDYSYPKRPEWGDSVLPVSFAFSPLRLMLPSFKTDGKTDYVLADDATIAKYGIREASITYDDIYPSITGATYNGQAIDEIKSVEAVDDNAQTFVVYLHDLGFDLESQLTNADAQISMKSGAMQGYTFTMSAIEKLEDNSYKITLGRISAEGGENYNIPNSDWGMKAGDKFVLLNILMPQMYIREAENRLLERAKEYLAQYAKTNFSYNIGLHDKFLVSNPTIYDSLIEGAKLSVYDEELGISEDVTIQSITITENMEDNILPQVKVTLNNKPSASTLDRIQGKIDALANETAGNSFATQNEIMAQYRRKLDKPFFDKLFVAVDAEGNDIASNDVVTPVSYIRAKYNLAVVGGVTSYAKDTDTDIPSLYDGLPLDNDTIYWEETKDEDGNVTGKLLKARGGSGEGGIAPTLLGDLTNVGVWANGIATEDRVMVQKSGNSSWEALSLSKIAVSFENVKESGEGNAYTTFELSEDKKVLTLKKGDNFAKQSDYETLSTKVTNFLEGADDTDTIINKWKELETFLSGMKESDDLAEILSGKANKATTLSGYGITDAHISGGVITLGGNTITPLTSHQTIYNLKLKSGTFSEVTFDPNGATKTVYIPTTTSHISEGVNLYFTDKRAIDALAETLAGYLPLSGGTITGDVRLREGTEYTSPYLYFGDGSEVYLIEKTDQYLTIHANKGVILDTPITSIDGIEIKKSSDGVLYIDGNLVVSGGITAYGADGTAADSIWDDAPLATTTTKGIASFDSTYFSVDNGVVTFIGSAGGGTADSVAWNNVTGKPSWIGSTKPSYTYSEISGTPTSLKNPYALTFGSKTYDGSAAKTILASDLGALTSHQPIYSLTINNSSGTAVLTYAPNSKAMSLTLTKAMVGLGNVENTALSTWGGSANITKLGTITSGTWNGGKIANDYLANPSLSISGTSVSLGGSITQAALRTALGLGTAAYMSNTSFVRNEGIGSESKDADDVAYNSIKHEYRWTNAAKSTISSIFDLTYSLDWRSQMQFVHSDDCAAFLRCRHDGSTWTDWVKLIHSGNYNQYAPTLTGTGASGTWGISITGNSGTATKLANARTIWGQSFNGTANVSGALSGATTGSFSGKVSMGSASIGGINISKSADGVLYLDGALVVAGGVTAYGDTSVTSSAIMEAIVVDGTTIMNDGTKLYLNPNISLGGGASSWDDIEGKPTWIGDTKPSYTFAEISGKPTTLSGYGITDATPVWAYSYNKGCLVKTNITADSNKMITFRIEGNAYGESTRGILTVGQFYDYAAQDTTMNNSGATHYGYDFGDIKAFNYGGLVYLWFKQPGVFQTHLVTVYCEGGINRVTSISNEIMPASGVTKTTTITPIKISLSGHTHVISDVANLQTTLDEKATVSALTAHTENKTIHITSTERTNWNTAYNNSHTHSNKSVLDGITSAKVSNWDGVVANWGKAFYFDANGNLRVKVNVVGEKGITAYGDGLSEDEEGAIIIVDSLTSTSTTAALSANQGRVLKDLIDSIGVDNIDLSAYYKKTEVDNLLGAKAAKSHTHTMGQISDYGTYVYDASITRSANTVLAAPNGSAGKATFRSLVAADIPTLAISKISGLQSALDGKSPTSHSHSNYVDLASAQTITGAKTFNGGIFIKTGTSINDQAGNGIIGVNSTGWTGLPSDGTAIGVGTIYNPLYLRTSENDLYHYRQDKGTHYNILDASNYSSYALPLSGGTLTGDVIAPKLTLDRLYTGDIALTTEYSNSLSSKGWYRFATSTVTNAGGCTCIFFIRTVYSNTQNENYVILANVDYLGCNFTQLGGHHNNGLITQIRCTYTNSSTMYFDLYYNGAAANAVLVSAIGTCTLQAPAATSSTLSYTNTMTLTNGYKSGVKTAYAMTLYRNAASGGCYIRYGANNQLTKSWVVGSDGSHNFSWDYKDESAGTELCKMSLSSGGNLSSDYWVLNNTSTNPYLKLTQGSVWYIQGYNGYLYLGAGSANSLRIDSSGNVLSVGGITSYSDARKKTILNHVELSLKDVAEAPLIEHYYNSDESKRTHVGSIAQYWAGLNDWFCKEDGEGFLTMEIQNAALASAISVARELTRYESKTDKQIKKLKKRIGELEDEIETLKNK